MRALSIRQPWAELILRGVKTVEYRSRPTRIVGERFYIYAGKGPFVGAGGIQKPVAGSQNGNGGAGVWSRDLGGAGDGPPGWMWELAEALILSGEPLPRGVIVGTAVIERVTPGPGGDFHWHLADVRRSKTLRKPTGHPQPVWFQPF